MLFRVLLQYSSGFLNPGAEMYSSQPGRVAKSPVSPPVYRELLCNDCSCTIVTTRSALFRKSSTVNLIAFYITRTFVFS